MNLNARVDEKKSLKAKTILIVDDDPSISRALFIILSSYGQNIVVDSGNKAIEVLRKRHVDLILTDCEMAQGTGLDLLEYLAGQNIKTPTIMITAFGTKELVLKTMKYNVFGFIEKPFSQNGVEELVKRALKVKDDSDKMQNLAMIGANVGEMVHEISSPLTVIDYSLMKLNIPKEGSGPDPLRKSIEKIRDIINNTRGEIRGDSPKDKLNLNFQEVLQDAKVEFDLRAAKGKVTVSLVGDFNAQVHCNRARMCQVIVNLVNNAIDAAVEYPDRWVRVEMERDEKHLRLLVTDCGTGIAPEIRVRLFEPLFTTKGQNGTGLGLGIVRKIANEHGGTVYLNPDAPNTQFVLVLPLA